jgi:alpha-ketoglutarate-dependent taurine dioxygenase
MSTEAGDYLRIQVKPVAGHIGADISGVDLSKPLDADTVGEIRTALLAHKVIFFRGQHLAHAVHVALGRQFGELTRAPGDLHGPHPEGFPQILTVDPDADDFEKRYRRKWPRHDSGWHNDLIRAVNPPAIMILRAEIAPVFGGDTLWTNFVAAYAGLSKPLQDLADRLRAEHTFFTSFQLSHSDVEDIEIMRKHTEHSLISVHPAVRIHPETGEKALFMPPGSVNRIVGLLPAEAAIY